MKKETKYYFEFILLLQSKYDLRFNKIEIDKFYIQLFLTDKNQITKLFYKEIIDLANDFFSNSDLKYDAIEIILKDNKLSFDF